MHPQKDIHEVSSSALRIEAGKYAQEQVKSQMAQFQELGIMSAWSSDTTYRTLGPFILPTRIVLALMDYRP